jgi:hypothetical protein
MNVLFMEYVQPMVYVNASKEEQEKIVASNTVQIIAMGIENVMQKDFASVKMDKVELIVLKRLYFWMFRPKSMPTKKMLLS